MFFTKKKKDARIDQSEFDYTKFTAWLNEKVNKPLPENTKGIVFNLYEGEQPHIYRIQFAATASFDLNDEDWACDEIFSSGETMYAFTSKNNWEVVLREVESNLKSYLEENTSASLLKKHDGIGLGFVDGDLIIIYQREN